MCLWFSYKKILLEKIFFFASFKSLKKEDGSISHRYGSGSGSAPKKSQIPNNGLFTKIYVSLVKCVGPGLGKGVWIQNILQLWRHRRMGLKKCCIYSQRRLDFFY
jgi:hypothetical protein